MDIMEIITYEWIWIRQLVSFKNKDLLLKLR